MLEDVEFEDIMDTLDEYNISYKMMECKARVHYRTKNIYLNPIIDEDIPNIVHEYTHIYTELFLGLSNLVESEIEKMSQDYLKNNYGVYHCLENYLIYRMEN